jgi:hypothetical protein
MSSRPPRYSAAAIAADEWRFEAKRVAHDSDEESRA